METKIKIEWVLATESQKLDAVAMHVMGWRKTTEAPTANIWSDGHVLRHGRGAERTAGYFNPLVNMDSGAELITRLEKLRMLVNISNRFEAGDQKWEVEVSKPEVASPGGGPGAYGYGASIGEALCKAALRMMEVGVDD